MEALVRFMAALCVLAVCVGCTRRFTEDLAFQAPSGWVYSPVLGGGEVWLKGGDSHGVWPPIMSSAGAAPLGGNRRESWMAAGAKNENLLYVSAYDSSQVGFADVFVFTYPAAKLEGRLTGFTSPSGLCTDAKGDVFVTDYNMADIVEYAHGDTIPVSTLSDPNAFPLGCSVDPTTGNLAVSNQYGPSGDHGSVAIYANASGAPMLYSDPVFFSYGFCAYDPAGDLYVDGDNGSLEPVFAVLARGSTGFMNITLPRKVKPGDTEWDGSHIAVASTGNIIYRLHIAGSRAHITGSTTLIGADGLAQFSIWNSGSQIRGPQGATLIGPDFGGVNVKFWNYPAGGKAVRTLPNIEQPVGTAVSKATK